MTRLALTALLLAGCATGSHDLPAPSAARGMQRFSDEGTGKQILSAAKHRTTRRHPSNASRSLRRPSLENRNPLNWPALAQCEASGNPRAVSMGRYFGLYQFDVSTWASVGGEGNPADATPAEQTHRARLLYEERGAAPWPVCGWRLAS